MKTEVYLGSQRVWQWLWLPKGLISFTSEREDQEMTGPCSLAPYDTENRALKMSKTREATLWKA